MISIAKMFEGKVADASKPPKVVDAMSKKIKKTVDPKKRDKLMGLFGKYQAKVTARPIGNW